MGGGSESNDSLTWPPWRDSGINSEGNRGTPQTGNLSSISYVSSSYVSLKIGKTFCLFFESMIPSKAIKRLFFFSFNLREEQMLTDKISPADSFVSDA